MTFFAICDIYYLFLIFFMGGESLLSKEEIEVCCNEFYISVYRYCLYFLSDKEDAEDATQETFVAFSRKGHLIEREHIKSWLFRTAHNMVLRKYRERYNKTNRESFCNEAILEASAKFTRFEEDMVSYYGERYVKEVYSRLSDREKELFDLYSDGTLKTGQIAEMLGIDSHTCSMRRKRLKDKCRDIMMEILFY